MLGHARSLIHRFHTSTQNINIPHMQPHQIIILQEDYRQIRDQTPPFEKADLMLVPRPDLQKTRNVHESVKDTIATLKMLFLNDKMIKI